MPRKKDGMLYELLPRPTKGEDGKPLLYPRPAVGFKYTARSIDDFCHKNRGMPMGDMSRFFNSFLDVAAWLMHDGSRVETPFGSFAPKLKLDGDYTDPEQVKSENVSLATIEFIPSRLFIEELENYLRTGFREKPNVIDRKSVHELRENGKIEEAMQDLMQYKCFTINSLIKRTYMKYSTARAYLNSLCKGEHPLLRKSKSGVYVYYYPIKNEEPEKE